MSVKTRSKNIHTRQGQLPSKKRALVVAIGSILSAGPVLAQDEPAEGAAMEEVKVIGMRQNLMNAQDLKYNADTVIESITADDLGSFPDKSIAEALQRVSGITVNRFAASDDTAHFSAEPSGVIVRGLNQVRTEFNGRDSFSANSSRGLSWTDVSPELMSGVDTYKNQTAELIEGGIAGTVNMRTRLPFDQDGQLFAVSFDLNYNDLAGETTPELSALYSNRWDTGIGEVGVMANVAYSDVKTRSEGIQLYRMNRFRDVYAPDSLHYFPAAVNFRDNLYDRQRAGTSLAFQWADPSEDLLFSVQYNRSEYDNAWEEYLVQTSPADLSFGESVLHEIGPFTGDPQDNTNPQPAPGTDPFTFDSRGLFQTGVVTTGTGWWGANDAEAATFAQNAAGEPMVSPCYGWNGCPPQRGIDTSTTTRSNNNTNMTQDLGFNFKWEISDTVRSSFDLHFIDSKVENYDIEIAYWTFANAAIDLSGEHPSVDLMDPTSVNLSPGGYANPNNYYIRSIMDHVEDSEGDEIAFRADFEFDIPSSGWVESVKTGVRFADRDQIVRWSTYNWQNVANAWTGGQAPYFNLDQHDPANGAGAQPGFTGYPEGHYVVRDFEEGFGNLTPGTFVFANMDLLQNQQLMASSMGATGLGLTGGTGWDPICSNTGDRADEIPGTCFTPGEIADVSEETQALYVQLNYGGADATLFGAPISGNIGVRYVKTTNESTGGVNFPQISPQDLVCEPNPPGPMGPAPVPNSVGCYLAQEDIDFMNGADAITTTVAEHEHWLPSFNLKYEFTDEWLMRFAASKAISRPDIGNLRNYVGLSAQLPSEDDPNDPLWIKDGSGTITGADVRYTGSAQNPFLAPVEAVQYDLSFEYYFADVGMFAVTLFDKKFDDYIQFGTYNRQETNNGSTQIAEIRGPLNGEGASLRGYELSFQRFFDFLPAPWDGLGIQANYTHIDNKGVGNTNVTNVGGQGTTITSQAPDQIGVNRLEGLSDDSYTLIAMYDGAAFSARLAYSWRSEYMVTAIDCCVAYPIWNDDYGQVDGSFTWHINDNLDFKFQGTNLTKAETRLSQQVSGAEDGGLLLPNAWFQNDRRYTIGLRFRY